MGKVCEVREWFKFRVSLSGSEWFGEFSEWVMECSRVSLGCFRVGQSESE